MDAMSPSRTSTTTPTGGQSLAVLRWRRVLVLVLNLATYAALAAALWRVLAAGGWTLAEALAFVCFLMASPWTVLGFWNALIGVALLLFSRDPLRQGLPLPDGADQPVRLRTAILLTVRNEDPARAFARLTVVRDSVAATGFGDRFSYFVLSDTSDPAIAAAEEAAFAAWSAQSPQTAAHYRRRADNTGYKAGNLRDFCERFGHDYTLMAPLDADSLMSGDAIVAMVRMMQANPRLGILQSLVVGLPSPSAFARIFQFGMRQGMRPYTLGSAWWGGDCGPFWGHNALVRIAAFRDHCALPRLPGAPPFGGDILSHDQVEATLMRRAGFEVRVLARECESYEENPPTLLEFVRRDLRWCLGNLQYGRLLALPGLLPMSRFQLLWAILMFAGLPAFTAMIALSPFVVAHGRAIDDFPQGLALGLYATFLAMSLMPKIAGVVDVLMNSGAARYGGAARFLLGAAIEVAFSFLQGAVSTFRTTLFMIALAFGKVSIAWSGQARDAHGVSFRTALAGLWPHLLFGVAIGGALAVLSPRVFVLALPLIAGYVLAVPFAMITASPGLGAFLARHRLCAIPEEFDTPPVIAALRAAQAPAP